MNTKLTLTIEDTIIAKAKTYARSKGRSLSDIIEKYLLAITRENQDTGAEISPLVKSMKGSFKVPENFDYKKELGAGLAEKYLK